MLYRNVANSRITVCRYYLRRTRGGTRSQRHQLCEHHQHRLRTCLQHGKPDIRCRITLETSVLGCFDTNGGYNVMGALNMITMLERSHSCMEGTRRYGSLQSFDLYGELGFISFTAHRRWRRLAIWGILLWSLTVCRFDTSRSILCGISTNM